jgi:hypothetical protein
MLFTASSLSFDDFLSSLDRSLASSAKRRPVFRRVFDAIAESSAALAKAAGGGEPPAELLIPVFGAQLKGDKASDLAHFVDLSLEAVLRGYGLRRLYTVKGPEKPTWLRGRRAIFYRPTEETLFDHLVSQEPVILFTTQEEHRFSRALALKLTNDRVPTYVWTLASGFQEPIVDGNSVVLRAVGDLRRTASNLTVNCLRLSELSDQDSLTKALPEPTLTGPVRPVGGGYDKDTHTTTVLLDDRGRDLSDAAFEALRDTVVERQRRDFDAAKKEDTAESFHKIPPPLRFADAIRKAIDSDWPSGGYLFLDAHRELDQHHPNIAENVRIVRDAFHYLHAIGGPRRLILFAHDFDVPDDLLQEVPRVSLPLPGRRELWAMMQRVFREHGHVGTEDSELPEDIDESIRRAVDAVSGLTLQQAEAAIRTAAARHGSIPPNVADHLQDIKCQQLVSEGTLQLIRELPKHDAGGLDLLGTWLAQRRRAFENPEDAARYGIDRRPKGVLMLGISGSGKSLAAKLVARDWGLPLLRLDAGALYDKYVGSSEARLRRALTLAETMAPCVLWIDEIEKGFGTTNDSTGVSQRVLGGLLVWMQETSAAVFTVATANDITKLPPELTRAGRFDNRFFLGCPGPAARKEILAIHLSRRGVDPTTTVTDALITATHGFTGAEIEQIVLDSLYAAYAQGAAISPELLVSQARRTKPLVAVLGSTMEHVWELLEQGRAELASSDLLGRREVAQLIDPHRFTPMYCRLKCIAGYERHAERAERIVASQPGFGSAVAVLEVEDKDWIYAQCNFALEKKDEFAFKFLDKMSTVEANDVFFMLCRDHQLDSIIFETPGLEERFRQSAYLSELQHLFSRIDGRDDERLTLTQAVEPGDSVRLDA